jgi:hypothetical protein
MIRDLSETLKALLDDDIALVRSFPELAAAQILFERPDERFSPGALTAVNLFLYDLREDMQLRSNEPIITRNNGQSLIQRAPLRVACSYLVTAWPVGGTDLALQEHRLLSQVLQVLAGSPRISDIYLQGKLKDQEPPLPMITAQTDGLKNPHEFWTAIGNKLRPSITVTATISMPVFADVTGPLVTTRFTGFDAGTGVIEETLVQIGGRVLGPGGQGIGGALVDLVDMGIRATTDAEGRYSFLRVPTGAHTIRAAVVGFQPVTQPLVVPGRPEDYEVNLTPLP